jgi:PQQ-like domain
MRRALPLMLALAGCGGGKSVLVVHVTASETLTDVQTLDVTVQNGADTTAVTVAPPNAPVTISPSSEQSFALRFAPDRSGLVKIDVSARGTRFVTPPIGHGEGSITPGAAAEVSVVLRGMGDLPDMGGSDFAAPLDLSSGPDLSCPGGRTLCSGTCVDTQADDQNCGGCGQVCPTVTGGSTACQTGTCTLDVDEAKDLLWSATAPNPCMAFWKDGTLLTANNAGGAKAVNLSWDGQNVQSKMAGADWFSRPTIFIPVAMAKPEVALSHYGSFDAYTEGFLQKWSNPAFGCCGSTPDGFPYDPVQGMVYLGDQFAVDGATGMGALGGNKSFAQPYIGPTHLYGLSNADNTVSRRARADLTEVWRVMVGAPGMTPIYDQPAAIAGDESLVLVSSKQSLVARVQPNSAKWEKSYPQPTPPVIAADGSILLGATMNGVPSLLDLKLADGTVAWSVTLDGPLVDALVAENGMIYVAEKGVNAVYGLRASDGKKLESYRNVSAPLEILLRNGVLYASSGGRVTAFPVTRKRYDPKSSWPVRYHDNQRTSSITSTLDY